MLYSGQRIITLAIRGDEILFYKWLYCLEQFADMHIVTQKAVGCLTNSV